jgi:hypothetical protein
MNLNNRLKKLELEVRPGEKPLVPVIVEEADSDGERALKRQLALVAYNASHGVDLSLEDVSFVMFTLSHRSSTDKEEKVNGFVRRIARIEEESEKKKLSYKAVVPETREPPLTVTPDGQLVAGRVKVAQYCKRAKVYRAVVSEATGAVHVLRLQ